MCHAAQAGQASAYLSRLHHVIFPFSTETQTQLIKAEVSVSRLIKTSTE